MLHSISAKFNTKVDVIYLLMSYKNGCNIFVCSFFQNIKNPIKSQIGHFHDNYCHENSHD